MPVAIQEVEVVTVPPTSTPDRADPAPRPTPPPEIEKLLRDAAERLARVRAH